MRRAQPEQVRREVGVEVAHRLEGGLVALEVDGPRVVESPVYIIEKLPNKESSFEESVESVEIFVIARNAL